MTTSTTQQPAPSGPCPCHQQFGEALPWLAATLAIVVGLDRWKRRKNSQKNTNGAIIDGAKHGETK